jgi:hypothetical protein
MRSIVNLSRFVLLVGCSYMLLCGAAAAQHESDPFNSTLADMERESTHKGPPQYVVVDLPEKKILSYYPELKGLVAAQSQQELPNLLQRVGANESQFLNTVPTVSAHENVVQEQLDKHGFVHGLPMFTGQDNYIVRAHVTGEGTRFSEGRADENWRSIDPNIDSGYSLAKGFALLPIYFHPFHQGAANFRYLGRQVQDGRECYVIAFAQQPEKTELLGTVRVNGSDIVVAHQGVAWIDPDSFQIVRVRVDLLKARPEAGTETTETRFSEVRLPVVAKSFWLPTDAVVTRSAKDGSLREKHQFSDYRIFVQSKGDVTTTQSDAQKPK